MRSLRLTRVRGVPLAGETLGFGVALTFLDSIEPYLTFEHTPDHWKHGLLIVAKGFILALHLNEDMVPTVPSRMRAQTSGCLRCHSVACSYA